MPIQVEVFHPNRFILAVVRGSVTIEEYQTFLVDMVKAGILHYRKLIDITSATPSAEGRAALLAIDARLRSHGDKIPRGPLAIVVDVERTENAQEFKSATSADRPMEFFFSIHAARRWLNAQPVIEPPPKPGG
ncbi:MAG TPA: hypothetical protein VMI56_02210 [Reyranella sp.]|nr:hypothetical protein [Reyranella sp.]